MLKVKFASQGVSALVPEGTTLVEAARAAGVRVESPCGGSGHCGKCRMKVSGEHLANLSITAAGPLSEDELRQGFVLGCHAFLKGDLEVEFFGGEPVSTNILSSGKQADTNLDPSIRKIFLKDLNVTQVRFDGLPGREEPGDTTGLCYGAAIDIGTTTLVASLIDLNTGEELAAASSLNPQTVFGHDVLSRIRMAADPEGLVKLRDVIIRELESMLFTLARANNIEPVNIYELVLSGNTCMLHLVAG